MQQKNGRKEKTIEIARNMLNKKLSIQVIEEITGLDRETIEKISR